MDVLTPAQRKKCMRSVKHEGTKAEIYFRKLLWQEGYRYRKNWRALPGKPDIALTKYKIAIFIDGEFWHGKGYDGEGYDRKKHHSLKEQLESGHNAKFWTHKIERNMQRDLEVEAELNGLGWRVIRFWCNDVLTDPEACLQVIRESVFDETISLL